MQSIVLNPNDILSIIKSKDELKKLLKTQLHNTINIVDRSSKEFEISTITGNQLLCLAKQNPIIKNDDELSSLLDKININIQNNYCQITDIEQNIEMFNNEHHRLSEKEKNICNEILNIFSIIADYYQISEFPKKHYLSISSNFINSQINKCITSINMLNKNIEEFNIKEFNIRHNKVFTNVKIPKTYINEYINIENYMCANYEHFGTKNIFIIKSMFDDLPFRTDHNMNCLDKLFNTNK